MPRNLDDYYGDDIDEGLTPQQREEKRLRQLDQHMSASQEDMKNIQVLKMRDEANHIKQTDPGLVADLGKRGKSVEQFILDRSYRPDLYQQQYEKGKAELLDKMYDEGNSLRLAPPMTPSQQRDEDFWGDKEPASPPEGGSEKAAAYNELQKANPQALTCDDKVEEQFRALTGLPPKKRIRR
jgi:hypothetical protein